jgi:SAM-dependent methyltransferase
LGEGFARDVVLTYMPKLYSELASWFHLLSAPKDYVEEAAFARDTLIESSTTPVNTVLELGAGGGNNASHMKSKFAMTLTDLSESMLAESLRINPECEHIVGDMRTLRLGRFFDAVFVHDALTYLTTREELIQCMKTAAVHCRRGGVALFMPDYVRETLVSGVHHGGHDGEGRSLRYFEWTFDPDTSDTTYTVDFVLLLREGNSPVRVEHDHHVNGLFPRSEWLDCFPEAGFRSSRMVVDPYGREVFVATL